MEENQFNKVVDDCEAKKSGSVWSKKPLNEVVELVSVMGGDDDVWPSLDQGVKAAVKSSSSDSLMGSSPLLHKLETVKNVNPATVKKHVAPSGKKPAKRGGGSSGVYVWNEVVSKQLTATDTKESAYKESPRGVAVDHNHQRNAYRRGNGGQHPRGDGSYHHNYAGKVVNRYNNMQPQRGNNRRGAYMRPAVHYSAPVFPPLMNLPMHPFGNVMYPDIGPAMIYVQGPAPFVGPFPAPVYYSPPDPNVLLHTNILNQIDYYFSNENLVRDTYLRSNMDEQGWVSVSLIAGFKKVKALTNNTDVIIDVMRHSNVVEVQDDKIRRRNDWMKWLMPPAVDYSYEGIPRSLSQDSLTSQLQGIALDEATLKNVAHVESFFSRLPSSGFERAAVV